MHNRGAYRPTMRRLPQLVVMVRAPVCGAVKTRLGKEIGPVAATALYRILTSALLRGVARASRWRAVLAVEPPAAAGARFLCWGPTPRRIPQRRGSLGARMQAIFQTTPAPCLIVGSDIPRVTGALIADAFEALREADAVFGPAEDGGFWLVGLRRPALRQSPFERVRWSSEYALADVLANLQGCRVAFARTLFDVDDAKDYRRLKRLGSLQG